MSKSSAQELVPFLQDRAGDSLRSVAYFDGDTREVLYAREDVIGQYSDERIDAIFDDLFFDAFAKDHQEEMYEHGSLNCVVRCFDGAVEMHFPQGEMAGTAVALEPEAATDNLHNLIGACLDQLYEEYPPALA